jgi:membrane protease YdiL (CAAX protease family)
MKLNDRLPLPTEEPQVAGSLQRPEAALDTGSKPLHPQDRPDIFWLLAGSNGLRSGWSVLIFIALYYLFMPVLGTIAVTLDPALAEENFSPIIELVSEIIPLLSILGAALILSRVEHRHLADYNLRDTRWFSQSAAGLLAGFLALSGLVATLALGGWLHISSAPLTGAKKLQFALLWAAAFLVVGLFEEGSFRCYLQFTLARGLNFWWAVAAVGVMCLVPQLRSAPYGVEGVYLVAAIGILPCWLVHRSQSLNASFWQAAWVTSTAFGAYHTGNPGETWIGIMTASFIGFIFCVSVLVTGSAWWAIGCHAAWDWAETYFYGTSDSGLITQSNLFTSRPTGNVLWSGGPAGPEGSLLAVPVVAVLLLGLLLIFRSGQSAQSVPAPAPIGK